MRDPAEGATLAAYLDTLIPPDGTPGAVELGMPEQIVAKAAESRAYRSLIGSGCRWLDEQARQRGASHFAALSAAERERIVTLAAGRGAGVLPFAFFRRTLADAIFYYYADPRSWPALGYPGPPQPRGFPDYADPPRRRTRGSTGV